MNTEHIEKFVNALACDLEEGGFRQVSGTTLRRSLTEAVSTALPLLADTGIPASQPAELAEQQGVEGTGHSTEDNYQHFLSYSGLDGDDLLRYAYYHGADVGLERPALAATGKQVGEVQGGARELLAAEYDAAGSDKRATLIRDGKDHAPSTAYAVRAIAAALAARQPGAQEPYGWIVTGPNGSMFIPLAAREVMEVSAKYMHVVEVYAAPPAQGIDLGLWAMHLQGPDDVHAAPSKSEALEVANAINREFARSQVKPYAVVIPWAGTAAEHAESSADWEDQWKVGNGQRDAAPGVE